MDDAFTDVLKSQTRKSTKPIIWNTTLDLAFKDLKNLVCKAPSLVLPDPSKPVQAKTNASDYAIGTVLYQDGKPIASESKILDSSQCRYTVQEKELFVVIHALKSWCLISM